VEVTAENDYYTVGFIACSVLAMFHSIFQRSAVMPGVLLFALLCELLSICCPHIYFDEAAVLFSV